MNVDFYKHVYPRIKESMKHTLEAFWLKHKRLNTYHKINHKSPLLADSLNQFELLGYDFMIDEDLHVYLIEVNTNPCLDTSPCALLRRLITSVLDQTFKVCVDPFV